MEKNARLATIRRLVDHHEISNQERLARLLEQEGFRVTQATLSRDLKYLQVGKVADGKGGYIYAFPESGHKSVSEQDLVEDFRRGYMQIDFSGDFGVIKTLPGHASTVAFAVDTLGIPVVLGTVAGDDTILVIPRDGVRRSDMLRAFKERIPGFQESEQ